MRVADAKPATGQSYGFVELFYRIVYMRVIDVTCIGGLMNWDLVFILIVCKIYKKFNMKWEGLTRFKKKKANKDGKDRGGVDHLHMSIVAQIIKSMDENNQTLFCRCLTIYAVKYIQNIRPKYIYIYSK